MVRARNSTKNSLSVSIEDLKRVSVNDLANTLAYVLEVGNEIGMANALRILAKLVGERKIKWCRENISPKERGKDAVAALDLERRYLYANSLPQTYRRSDIEVVKKSPMCVVSRHRGFCTTLEACKLLGLKTSDVCPIISLASWEMAYRALVNPKITVKITKLRPKSKYCEEVIELKR